MNDIDKKIDSITKLSQSQVDRLTDTRMLLAGYINSYVEKVQEDDVILTKLKEKYLEKIEKNELSDGAELRIFELLLEKQSADNTPLINLFAKALEVKAEQQGKNANEQNSNEQKDNAPSKEDIALVKEGIIKIDKLLDKLEKE